MLFRQPWAGVIVLVMVSQLWPDTSGSSSVEVTEVGRGSMPPQGLGPDSGATVRALEVSKTQPPICPLDPQITAGLRLDEL